MFPLSGFHQMTDNWTKTPDVRTLYVTYLSLTHSLTHSGFFSHSYTSDFLIVIVMSFFWKNSSHSACWWLYELQSLWFVTKNSTQLNFCDFFSCRHYVTSASMPGYTCDCHRALATGKFKKSHITTRNIKSACVATALSCWVAVAVQVVLWLIVKPDSTLGKSIVLQVNDHDPIMSPPMGNQHEYIKDSKRIAHNISRTILFPAL